MGRPATSASTVAAVEISAIPFMVSTVAWT